MASTASRSPVHREPARQRLTSPWTLLGIAVAVGVTLVLIFPGRGLLTQSAKQRADELSLAYLSDLARREPNNAELRFTLAEKQSEAGRIAEARAALEPLLDSIEPAVRQRARLEDFKLRMREMQALPARSAARSTETERLREALAAMSQYEWSTPALLEFAGIANELGAHRLRADLYLRIARGGGAGKNWTDEAARTLLGEGEYTSAAEIYFAALRNAQTRADQRRCRPATSCAK
jgi:tetratricopeptide (TPR) repeat protein